MDKLACSILKANFLNLDLTLKKLENANINWIHYDVMDDHFVPNLSFGPWILENIASKYGFSFDIHLMVNINTDVNKYLHKYLHKNVKQITLHIEALSESQINTALLFCKHNNLNFSLAVNPQTKLELLTPYLKDLDNILLMAVEPGFGGQKLNNIIWEKIETAKELKIKNNFKYKLQVDGGVNGDNIAQLLGAGIDWAVVGSWFTDNLDDIENKVMKIA